jgi:hypothetical protein
MKQPTFRLLFFVLLIVQLSVFTLAQSINQPLEQGKPVERELKGGESHAYTFKPEAGQFAAIVVDQRGIDVAVLLFAPDGKQLAEIDSPNGANGPEPVSLVARTTGDFRVEIRSLEKAAAAGRLKLN